MLNSKQIDFIKTNLEIPASELALRHNHDAEFRLAVAQIAARQKIRDKLPTFYSNLELLLPTSIPLEQASSELTARYKSEIISFTTSVDLTGGLGIDSIYLAMRAKSHHYIEQNQELYSIFMSNLSELAINNVVCINDDSIKWIKEQNSIPDLIYLDPARRGKGGNKTYFLEDTEPNPIEIIKNVKHNYKYALIKTSPMLDITKAISQLEEVREVHIVSVKNECKELLFLLEKDYIGDIRYHTVNFENNSSKKEILFLENTGTIQFSEPKKYIYEANASINKLGFWNSLASRYSLSALDSNTHIFTSDNLISDFPGRIFTLDSITKINRKEISKAIPCGKANISIKNVPIDINILKKKTALTEGGDMFLYVVKSKFLGNICLVCRKA